MKTFLIGSKAFFSGFDDFVPVDTDILIFDDEPDYEISKSYMDGNTHYVRWDGRMSKRELIDFHKYLYTGRYIQKFLVPEVVEYLGLTIEELKEMDNLIKYLDDQHTYIKIVYDSYIENNGFFLTDEQLQAAYDEYNRKRQQ